jgi:hypothetical protein
MLSSASRALLSIVLIGSCVIVSVAQEVETIKTDTNLVTVPVIVTSVSGLYITDLTKNEFKISEDGVPHEIAFFGKLAAPFHVILLLDTSASTKDKLRQIQNAAFAFTQQLKPPDRVKIISFDNHVRDLNEFTSDRETLRTAINSIRSGEGTKIYDAFELALNIIRGIQGRKAIVVFSDGMDWHSDTATFDGTLRNLDEEGVMVYPIRYETRATTEALARQQQEQITPTLPTRDVIRRPPSGTTAPTFPGGDPIPTTGTQQRTGPFGLPLPEDIMRRRRETERDRRYPDPNDPNRLPGTIPPDDRIPPEQRLPDRRRIPGQTDPPSTTTTSRRTTGPDDEITRMLDMAYAKADDYLNALAQKSGGRLLRADTLAYLPEAFAQIAAELRTQYLLGYYPLNKEHDQRYRRIKVASTRKDVMIRARPGYLATGGK